MFCTNCLSTVSECGMDVYIGKDERLVEEKQFECDANCTDKIASVLLINCSDLEFYGVAPTPEEKEAFGIQN